MENCAFHFSSPKQNNDIIVYHNRAKSTLGSQTSRSKGRLMIGDVGRETHNKALRIDRYDPSSLISPTHLRPLQNRGNIMKDNLENSPQSNACLQNSFLAEIEHERKLKEVEDENHELKKQFKAYDTKIENLLKESETIKAKLNTFEGIEEYNNKLINENKHLKFELEALRKKNEENEARLLLEKTQKASHHDEVNHGLIKYTNYILNYIKAMDNNHAAHFCFEERFSSEKRLSSLIEKGEHGTIALQAFRYISDLLAHVTSPGEKKSKDTNIIIKREEFKTLPSEPSSICLSPVKNESKNMTARTLVREMENKKGMLLEGFDKVHEARNIFQSKGSKSPKVGSKEGLKSYTTREPQYQHMKKISCCALGQTPKNLGSSKTPSLRPQKSTYAQMHGRQESKQLNERDVESLKKGQTLINKRRELDGKERDDDLNEKALLLSVNTNKRSERQYEKYERQKNLGVESKEGIKKERIDPLDRRRFAKGDSETYSNLGVNVKSFGNSQCGRRAKELETKEKDEESFYLETQEDQFEMKGSVSVKSLLRQGSGMLDRKKKVELIEDEEGKKQSRNEKIGAQRIQRSLSRKNLYLDGGDNTNEMIETRLDTKKTEPSGESVQDRAIIRNKWFTVSDDVSEEEYNKINAKLKSNEEVIPNDYQLGGVSEKTLPLWFDENNSERLSKLLNISQESSDLVAFHGANKDPAPCSKRFQYPQPLEDIKTKNLHYSKDSLRLQSLQSPTGRLFSTQAGTPVTSEQIAERFVTFDAADSQNLFLSSDKEKDSELMSIKRRTGSNPQDIEHYASNTQFIRIENSKFDRLNSEKSNNIINALNKKRIEQKSQSTLSKPSLESNRTKYDKEGYDS